MNIRIRPITDSEHAFVYSTFINGFVRNNLTNLRQSSRWGKVPQLFRAIPESVLCQYYHNQIESHLSEGTCLVATDSDNTILLGYILFKDNTLYFMYIKPDFKQFQIDKLLLDACSFNQDQPITLPYRNPGLVSLLEANNLHIQ